METASSFLPPVGSISHDSLVFQGVPILSLGLLRAFTALDERKTCTDSQTDLKDDLLQLTSVWGFLAIV